MLAGGASLSLCSLQRSQAIWRAGVGLLGLALALSFLNPEQATGEEGKLPNPLAGRLTLSSAPEFSSGDYGQSENTEVWYVPFSAKYEFSDLAITSYDRDRLSFKITIPFIRIDGPSGIIWGTGAPIVGSGRGQSAGPGGGGPVVPIETIDSEESGLGDLIVSASYGIRPPVESPLPWFLVSAKVKIPTASESKGLGTGKADYTVFSEIYKPMGQIGFFVGGGYRFMGDPKDFELQNRWLASVGLDLEISNRVGVGVSYDYREGATSSSPDAHEISPWITIHLDRGLRVDPYAVFGLSNGSPSYGAGLRFSWSTRTNVSSSLEERPNALARTTQSN